MEIKLIQGDCLEVMDKLIANKIIVDAIIVVSAISGITFSKSANKWYI